MDDNKIQISDVDLDKIKPIVKEAIKEWLNENAASFGWFTLKTIVAVAFAGTLWLYTITGGFKIK